MIAILVVLYVMSFILPTLALSRYVIRANGILSEWKVRTEVSGTDHRNYAEDQEAHSRPAEKARSMRDSYVLDVVLIGSGTACGALASIIALSVDRL